MSTSRSLHKALVFLTPFRHSIPQCPNRVVGNLVRHIGYTTRTAPIYSTTTQAIWPTNHLLPIDVRGREIVEIGQWSLLEDRKLRKSVKKHGINWQQVAKDIKGRSHEQCAARWLLLDRKTLEIKEDHQQSNIANTDLISSNRTETTNLLPKIRIYVDKPIDIGHHKKKQYYMIQLPECGTNWLTVAKHLPGRSPNSCRSRWYSSVDSDNKRGRWTPEEDDTLRKAISKCPQGAWTRVASYVPGRTSQQCRTRWNEHLNSHRHAKTPTITKAATMTRKGRWSEREKQRLNELVSKYGFLWTAIAYQLKTRTATQCRDQWRSTLMPGIKLGHWTEEEDALLRQGVKKYKRRWKLVAAMVPGRTARQCCARWDASIDPRYAHSSWTLVEDEQLMAAVISTPGDPEHIGFDWHACAHHLNHQRNARQCRERYRRLVLLGKTDLISETESLTHRLYQSFLSERYLGHASNDVQTVAPNDNDNETETDLFSINT